MSNLATECPICGRKCRSWLTLARHLRKEHADDWSSDFFYRLECDTNIGTCLGIQCWCGKRWFGPYSVEERFAQHLEAVGGPHSCILEQQLLLESES